MHGISFVKLLAQGWPVLGTLMVMSVVSLAVILDRFHVFRRARLNAPEFVRHVSRLLRVGSREEAHRYCSGYTQPVARACAAVVASVGSREARERALQHAIQAEARRLEAYVPILGTIAATSPFIGLFGTVLGIIRAFEDIAKSGGGGPEVVAVGIAEALVSTAAGLAVAIPALIAYNYFVRKTERLMDEIDLVAYDLVEISMGEAGARSILDAESVIEGSGGHS
jgi:biopolymer transport protein ExbB